MKFKHAKISKALYFSVLMSLFCPIQAFAKNRIVPKTQVKMAPAVSPNQTPDQIQDNFEPAYQDNYQVNYQENYQDYPEQNMQNPEDVAYLDREIQNPAPAMNQINEGVEIHRYEENSAQLSDGGYAESEFQN